MVSPRSVGLRGGDSGLASRHKPDCLWPQGLWGRTKSPTLCVECRFILPGPFTDLVLLDLYHQPMRQAEQTGLAVFSRESLGLRALGEVSDVTHMASGLSPDTCPLCVCHPKKSRGNMNYKHYSDNV